MRFTGSSKEHGASSVEYALLAFFIGAAILFSIRMLGSSVADSYNQSCQSLATASATTC